MFGLGIGNMVLIGMLSAAVMTLGYYVREYDSRGTQIAVLETKQKSLGNEIRVLESSIKLGKDTNDSLNKRLGERNQDLSDACKLIAEVEADRDPESDKPVPGVIGKVLESFKKGKK